MPANIAELIVPTAQLIAIMAETLCVVSGARMSALAGVLALLLLGLPDGLRYWVSFFLATYIWLF